LIDPIETGPANVLANAQSAAMGGEDGMDAAEEAQSATIASSALFTYLTRLQKRHDGPKL
jgi:hypothetical protein